LACLGRACLIGLVGEVVIDGTSRKVDIASTAPSTALE
jgi:hypothetical protein